jgi:hypothetical protein
MIRIPSKFMLIAGSAALGFATASIPAGARADILQPWCLSGGGGLTDHCDFATFAQCQTTSAGYGVCSPNPAYTSSSPTPVQATPAKRRAR